MAAVRNVENEVIIGTQADVLRVLAQEFSGICNVENLKIIVCTDKQLADAISRVLWPDPKKVRK